ncbi:MAG TPA: HlyD family efflux transporter periplasmic adaptor subunit [Thermoanaerobaculia bacterium]|nr:HlyD family efflux transporter periplasmic adaptor subunit [Thermoanaerobaculia bacterium]
MKRKAVIGASIALLLVTAFGVTAAFRHPADTGMPTFRVEPAQFRRQVTADGTLKAVKATPVTTPNQANRALKIAWIETDGAVVKKGDVIVRFDPTEFENELLNGSEERATASNRLTKVNSDSSTTKTNLKRDARQAESELEAAQRFKFDDAEIFSRYQRIESEVDADLAGDKKQYAEEVLRVRETLSRTDLDLIAIEDRKAGLRIRNAENGLKALEIIAPYDGILVLQRDWRGEIPRVGSTQWPGSPIAEIPELNDMKAEVFVLEADAAGLGIDQKATVWLESDPNVKYQGKVTALDKLARPRMRGVPVQYFGVTVSLDRTDVNKMKPGARVRAVLEVENLENAFAIPRQAMFEKDGKKLVYRRRDDRFEPVEVTISSSSAGRVVVTKGLEKGDELALRDPLEETGEGDDRSKG